MKQWVFVHNQFRGLPPDVVLRLEFLKKCRSVQVMHWGDSELRQLFFELSGADQAAILGNAPTPQSVLRIELADIIRVVKAVSQVTNFVADVVPRVPPGKLEANALSTSVRDLLLLGSARAKLVKDFFAEWNDPLLGDRVAASFRFEYKSLVAQGLVGDEIFHGLWKYAGLAQHGSVAQESAVLALLAFLFEECEIFEPPVLKEAT